MVVISFVATFNIWKVNLKIRITTFKACVKASYLPRKCKARL